MLTQKERDVIRKHLRYDIGIVEASRKLHMTTMKYRTKIIEYAREQELKQ